MADGGEELRAQLARLLNERELLNLEVDRLRARMLQLDANLRRLQQTHAVRVAPPWPAAPSNVIPFKRGT